MKSYLYLNLNSNKKRGGYILKDISLSFNRIILTKMNWKLYSFVIRGKYRKMILLALDIERTPSEISKITQIHLSHVSRSLSELNQKRLIKCLNPEDHIGKVFRISKIGKELINQINKNYS